MHKGFKHFYITYFSEKISDFRNHYIADIIKHYSVKTLYILRGLPGQGKSYWSLNCPYDFETTDCVFSSDKYFIRPDGLYDFNKKLLHRAHKSCKRNVELAMMSDWKVIVLDNTNVKRKDFKDYIAMAEKHGYRVIEKLIGGFDEEAIKLSLKRNIHGVPEDTIRRMAASLKSSIGGENK